jgi:ABC-type polysaccharide/polyol phosphate transport system ATPase subunit
VRQLCPRALMINEGVLLADGLVDEVIARYDELLHQPVGG